MQRRDHPAQHADDRPHQRRQPPRGTLAEQVHQAEVAPPGRAALHERDPEAERERPEQGRRRGTTTATTTSEPGRRRARRPDRLRCPDRPRHPARQPARRPGRRALRRAGERPGDHEREPTEPARTQDGADPGRGPASRSRARRRAGGRASGRRQAIARANAPAHHSAPPSRVGSTATVIVPPVVATRPVSAVPVRPTRNAARVRAACAGTAAAGRASPTTSEAPVAIATPVTSNGVPATTLCRPPSRPRSSCTATEPPTPSATETGTSTSGDTAAPVGDSAPATTASSAPGTASTASTAAAARVAASQSPRCPDRRGRRGSPGAAEGRAVAGHLVAQRDAHPAWGARAGGGAGRTGSPRAGVLAPGVRAGCRSREYGGSVPAGEPGPRGGVRPPGSRAAARPPPRAPVPGPRRRRRPVGRARRTRPARPAERPVLVACRAAAPAPSSRHRCPTPVTPPPRGTATRSHAVTDAASRCTIEGARRAVRPSGRPRRVGRESRDLGQAARRDRRREEPAAADVRAAPGLR